MSPTLIKILVAIGGVLTIGVLGLVIYNQEKIKTQQDAIQQQLVAQKELADGLVRSQNQYASKQDIEDFAKANNLNLNTIQSDLDKLHAEISSINLAVANSQTQHVINVPTTSTGPTNPNPQPIDPNNPDPFGYLKNQQDLVLNENFGSIQIPFGQVGFSAWQKDPWNIDVKARQYNLNTIVGTDENQRQYYYNKFTVLIDDKTYDIPITSATTKQEFPLSHFTFWNPRLLMGLDGGVNINHIKGEFTPSINIGIMSYGQYNTTPDFSILEVGVGFGAINKTPEIVITPVAYNFGRNLFSPLMNNTYIGPNISIATDGSIGAGAGLRVGF